MITQSLSLLLLVIATVALGGCHPSMAWRGIIKIGLVEPFSGPAVAHANEALEGAREAVQEWNARGGASGYRIVLVAIDAEETNAAANVAADPAVVAVAGPFGVDDPNAPKTYQREGVIWLRGGPAAGITAGTYRMVANLATLVKAGRRLRVQAIGRFGLSIVDRQDQSCQGLARMLGPVKIVDFGRLDNREGGVVVGCGQDPAAAERLIAVAQRHPEWPILCLTGCDEPEFAARLGAAPMRYLAVVPAKPADTPAGRALEAALKGSGRPVTGYSALGYDAVSIVAAAVQKSAASGDVSRPGVARALGSTSIVGAAGVYGLLGRRHPAVDARGMAGQYPGQRLFRVEEAD